MRKASTSRRATGPAPGESGFQRSEGGPERRAVSRPGWWCLGDRHGGWGVSREDQLPGQVRDRTRQRSLTTTWVVRGEASLVGPAEHLAQEAERLARGVR